MTATLETHRMVGGRMRRRDVCNQRGPDCLVTIDPNGPRNCAPCSERIALHRRDRAAYDASRDSRTKLGRSRTSLPRVLVVERSGNKKLGGMPTTVSSAETCPDACALKGEGCFAEFGMLGAHWGRVPKAGLAWGEFLDWAWARPDGQLWRHNEAGDLPGRNDYLDVEALGQLVRYARGSRPFTYSAKPLIDAVEREAIRNANASGFVINLSSNSPSHADERAALGVGPVVTIVAPGTRTGDRTPGGRRIVVCPAQTEAKLTCAECRICAVPDRVGIVGFLPHGQMAGQIARRLPVLQRERRVA